MINITEIEDKDLEIIKLKEQVKDLERQVRGVQGAYDARAKEYSDNLKFLRERTLWDRITNRMYL